VRTSRQAGDKVAHHRAKPKGEMRSRGATRCHLQTHLLGKEGLPPRGDAGNSQATSLTPVVQLLPGQPLTMATPKESPGEAGGPGSHRLGEREYLSQVPQLAEDEGLQHVLLSLRKGTRLALQPEMAPCTLHRQSSQERETVAPREGAKVTPNVLRASGALTQVRRYRVLVLLFYCIQLTHGYYMCTLRNALL
jgi:hypothetical protein